MAKELELKRCPDDFSILSPLGEDNGKDYIADLNGRYLHAGFLELGEEVDESILLMVNQMDAPSLDKPLFEATYEEQNKYGLLFELHLGGSLEVPQEDLPEFSDFVEAIYLALKELWGSGIHMELSPNNIYFDEGHTYLGYPFMTTKKESLRDVASIFAYFALKKNGVDIDYLDIEDKLLDKDETYFESIEEEIRNFLFYLANEDSNLDSIRRYLSGSLELSEEKGPGFAFQEESYPDAVSLMKALQDNFLYGISVIENYESNGLLPFLLDSDLIKGDMAEFYLTHSSRDPALALFQLIHLYIPNADFVYGKSNYGSVKQIAHDIQNNPKFMINPILLRRDYLFAALQGDDSETLSIRNKLERMFEAYPSLNYEASKAALANALKERGTLYFKGYRFTVNEFAKSSLRLLEHELALQDLLEDPQAFLSFFLLSDGSVEQEVVMPLLGEKDVRRFCCKLSVILTNALPFYHEGDNIETPLDFIKLSNEAYESGGEEDKEFFKNFFESTDFDIMNELFPGVDVLVEAKESSDPLKTLYYATSEAPKYGGRFSSVEDVVTFVLASDDPEFEAEKLLKDPAFKSFIDWHTLHKK